MALNLLTKLRIFLKLPTSSSMNSTLLLPSEALMASVALHSPAALDGKARVTAVKAGCAYRASWLMSSSMNSTLLLVSEALMASIALQHAAVWDSQGTQESSQPPKNAAFLGSMWYCSCLSFTTGMHAHVLLMLRLLPGVHGIYRKAALGSPVAALACMQ